MTREELLRATTVRVAECAALMDVSLGTAYAGVKSGEIPVIRTGRRVRIPAAWVRAQLGLAEPGDAAFPNGQPPRRGA